LTGIGDYLGEDEAAISGATVSGEFKDVHSDTSLGD
jgi:hypothetical protein